MPSSLVSDACQINDFDHDIHFVVIITVVSDACQINDFDHRLPVGASSTAVSDACQINDFDHNGSHVAATANSFRCLSDQ